MLKNRRQSSAAVVVTSFVLVTAMAMTGFALTANATPLLNTIELVAGDYGSLSGPQSGVAGTATSLDRPAGVAVDAEGNYLIADRNGFVQVLANSATNPGYDLGYNCTGLCTWTQGDIYDLAGVGAGTADGSSAQTYDLYEPTGIAVDSSGNIIIPVQTADNVLVLAVSSSNPGYPLRSDCGSGSSACTWTPGDIYVIVGDGTNAALSDGTSATTSTMEQPDYATFDSSGNLLIDDYGSAVVALAMSTSNPGYTLASDCGGGASPCTWTKGHVYTLAGHWGPSSFALFEGQSGFAWYFEESRGIAVDSSNNLIITDSDTDELVVLAESASNPGYVLASDCGSGSTQCTWTPGDAYVLTEHPYYYTYPSASGSSALNTNVGYPTGTTFDAQGNLLFVNNHFQVVDMLAMSNCSSSCSYGLSSYTKGSIYIIAGGGVQTAAPYGDGGAPTAAAIGSNDANFLAVDDVNNMVVLADAYHNVVRSFGSGFVAPSATSSTSTSSTTSSTTLHHNVATTTTSTTTTTTTTTLPPTTTTTLVRSPIREHFYFAVGVTTLTPSQQVVLLTIAKAVKKEKFPSLSVVGYSDPTSSGAAASAVGLARATAVAQQLRLALAAVGDGGVTVGLRSGGVLNNSTFSIDRVAIVSS